jgi:hypothetical protein
MVAASPAWQLSSTSLCHIMRRKMVCQEPAMFRFSLFGRAGRVNASVFWIPEKSFHFNRGIDIPRSLVDHWIFLFARNRLVTNASASRYDVGKRLLGRH